MLFLQFGKESTKLVPVVFESNFFAQPSAPSELPLVALWPDPLPNGTVGTFYTYTLTATGGIAPYTYTIASGVLPTGITLAGSTGVVSGTPSVTASMDAVSFTVTDSGP